MDLEQYRKIAEAGLKADKMQKYITSQIEQYEDAKLMGYEAAKLQYKPIMEAHEAASKEIIKSQEAVKKANDEKQDELIKQLQQNQFAIEQELKPLKAIEYQTRDQIVNLNRGFAEYDKEIKKKIIYHYPGSYTF